MNKALHIVAQASRLLRDTSQAGRLRYERLQ